MKALGNYLYEIDQRFIELDDLVYEFSVQFKDLSYDGETVFLPLTDSDDSTSGYDVEIGNAAAVSWRLDHEAFAGYLDGGYAYITNIRLLRDYVEDLSFSVEIQFFPNCRLTIKMKGNCDPLLRINKVARKR